MLGNEKGYALFESLIALALLSIVSLSLVIVLPTLLDEISFLDTQQAIYHQLFELHQGRDAGIDVFSRGYEWCTVYERRDGRKHEICL